MSNEVKHEIAKELDRLEAEVKRTHRELAANKRNEAKRTAAAKAVENRDRLVTYIKTVLKFPTRQRRNSYGSRSGSESHSRSGSRNSHGSRRGGRRTKRKCRS